MWMQMLVRYLDDCMDVYKHGCLCHSAWSSNASNRNPGMTQHFTHSVTGMVGDIQFSVGQLIARMVLLISWFCWMIW